jgi:methyltransferase, FkbM family
MSDGRRPRTANWDRAYVDALHDLGAGIVYGDDVVYGEVLPVQVAVTADIVRALGYMAPPRLRSTYVDRFWLELGTAAGCLHHLPGIVIDDTPAARTVDDPAGHTYDRTVFWGWRKWRMPSDTVKVREVVALAMLERQSEAAGMKRVTMARDQSWTFNLLPEALAELGIDAKAVLHVGAHRGEEVPVYRSCGFGSIVLVEPDPGDAEFLRVEFPDVTVVEQACSAREGVATLHRAGVFAGLAADPSHPATDTVSVSAGPLREVQAEHPANVLVIDTQGTELEVLASADLANVDLVIVETQAVARGLYAAFWPDAVEALAVAGFVPAIRWEHQRNFADTLFVRAPADA